MIEVEKCRAQGAPRRSPWGHRTRDKDGRVYVAWRLYRSGYDDIKPEPYCARHALHHRCEWQDPVMGKKLRQVESRLEAKGRMSTKLGSKALAVMGL